MIYYNKFKFMDNKKNKLTLLVDSNWLLISRASVLMNTFNKNLPEEAKEQAQLDLEDLMAKSICVTLSRIPAIDNIVLLADGGSWRKQLQVPKNIEGTIYKGNRSQDNDIEWSYIYKALSNLISRAKEMGLTVTQYNNIEGDDWVWYWTRRLNSDGINCIIWSSDNDLKQLIQVDKNSNAFTAWYNDRNGVWLPDTIKEPEDNLDFFFNIQYYSPVLESIKTKVHNHNYINPTDIITSKVICGDAGDNILPVMRYKKGNKTYRITEKDWDGIKLLYNINSFEDFLNQIDKISEDISLHKKFKQYHPKASDIKEMIEYNIKLVWLNENVIPDTIIQFMNQQEYKKYDVQYLRSNYRVLTKEDDIIKNLFEGI